MMPEKNPETVLRSSLEAIDHLRARVTWAGYVAVVMTGAAFWWLDHVARTTTDMRSLLMAAVLALTSVIAWSTFALAIFIMRMTKRILRAIDFASARV